MSGASARVEEQKEMGSHDQPVTMEHFDATITALRREMKEADDRTREQLAAHVSAHANEHRHIDGAVTDLKATIQAMAVDLKAELRLLREREERHEREAALVNAQRDAFIERSKGQDSVLRYPAVALLAIIQAVITALIVYGLH